MSGPKPFKVEGLRGLDQALIDIGKAATAKAVGRRALKKALQPVDDGWRQRARVLSGDLKESGGVTTRLSRRQRKQHRKSSDIEMFAGPGPNPQSITEEFGTADQAPHPMLRPAWDENKSDLPAKVGEELWIDIEKTAKRAERRAARLLAKG